MIMRSEAITTSYQELIGVAKDVAKMVTRWPRGYAYLVDQVKRAMASSILNLSEGNAKRSSHAERRRFFEISMGSIAEVSACIDLASAFGLVGETQKISMKSRLKLSFVKIRALP